jgi:hypothetical protein
LNAIDALSLVGVSAEWVAAMAAHPADFQRFLRQYKRTIAPFVHPDSAPSPSLAEKAAQINAAFDLLQGMQLDTLAEAMRSFASTFSRPRRELLDDLAALNARCRQLTEQARQTTAKAEALVSKERKEMDLSERRIWSDLFEFYSAQLRTVPSRVHEGRHLVRIIDLRGVRFISTPLTRGVTNGEAQVFWVDDTDRLQGQGAFNGAGTSEQQLIEASHPGDKESSNDTKNCGRVIGFLKRQKLPRAAFNWLNDADSVTLEDIVTQCANRLAQSGAYDPADEKGGDLIVVALQPIPEYKFRMTAAPIDRILSAPLESLFSETQQL